MCSEVVLFSRVVVFIIGAVSVYFCFIYFFILWCLCVLGKPPAGELLKAPRRVPCGCEPRMLRGALVFPVVLLMLMSPADSDMRCVSGAVCFGGK